MASFNKVFLIGNLTRDPELNHTPNGTAVVELGMATNRKFKSATGEQKEEVCFLNLSAFGRKAEVMNEYLQKGSPLLVEGRLKFSSWETKEGEKRNKLSVIVENFQFLGTKGGGKKYDDGDVDPMDVGGSTTADIGDDDIPF